MPANASGMLLQALSNFRVPRVVPQRSEPSNQADVYATRGVLGDGLAAWQTLQGRNEGAQRRSAERAQWEAQNANAIKLRELINAGQMDVTRLQGENALVTESARGENALRAAAARAAADALARGEEQAWTERVKLPHELKVQSERNRGLLNAARARVPRGSPVPADKGGALFESAAKGFEMMANRLAIPPSFSMDRRMLQQRDEERARLASLAANARALMAAYQESAMQGDAAGKLAATQQLKALMQQNGLNVPAAAPQRSPEEEALIEEARARGDTQFLQEMGVE